MVIVIEPISNFYVGTCLSQSLLWTCPASSNNETIHFPNFTIDQTSLENSIQDSPYLSDIGIYIYHFQPMITDSQCNGETSVQFCFENSENSTYIEMLVVLGTILFVEPDGTSLTGRVQDQISINTTVECIPELSNDYLCCQSERITITLTNETNAFAVQFPNQTLLEYNGSQSQVETFVATQVNVIGVGSNGLSIIQASGRFMDLNLRFLQFVINPQDATTSNFPTLIIIIATVVPAGSLLLILVLIAMIITGTQCRKRKKRKKKAMNLNEHDNTGNSSYYCENKMALDSILNHVGDDLMLYNDGANNDGANSIDNYDYAMVSGEVSDNIKSPCSKFFIIMSEMATTQFLPPPITPDLEDSTNQQLYEPVEFQASLREKSDGLTVSDSHDHPVSDSVGTGTEAMARLSSIMSSQQEADKTNNATKNNDAYGESIVIEKDVAYPATIVDDNSEL